MLWRSPAPTRHPPGFIEPCLPTLGHTVPSGPQWAYEIKHDGYRFICRRDTYGVLAAGENKMAFAIGLLIFAAVIGSHGFLWWSCSRHGG